MCFGITIVTPTLKIFNTFKLKTNTYYTLLDILFLIFYRLHNFFIVIYFVFSNFRYFFFQVACQNSLFQSRRLSQKEFPLLNTAHKAIINSYIFRTEVNSSCDQIGSKIYFFLNIFLHFFCFEGHGRGRDFYSVSLQIKT